MLQARGLAMPRTLHVHQRLLDASPLLVRRHRSGSRSGEVGGTGLVHDVGLDVASAPWAERHGGVPYLE